ncbi:MAG: hypothetical protein PHY48_14315, partial [Candidatus Cloacimonetes bacterium]|nr:hypothetical protein [Candidatus Cloacimonadota bacterium]
FKALYPMVFSADSLKAVIRDNDPSFTAYQGKVIRKIRVFNLEVFKLDPKATNKSIYNLILSLGNNVHLNTREWVVRENLFFREGDHISPSVFKRNLYYLRNLNYISDVRIMLLPVKNEPDSIDVVLILRDKFSINPGGTFSSFSKFSMQLDDRNFLGFGQQLQNTWHIDAEHKGSVGWESLYSVPNIHGTFIQGELSWQDLPGYTRKSFFLNRPFLFPALRNAGGVESSETYVRAPVDTITVDKIVIGGWYGRSFGGKPGSANQYKYAALSLQQTWFHKRPPVADSYGRLWHENLLAMASIGITQSDFRSLPHVYSFLENDAIPVGFLLEFPFGYEIGEFRNREFIGIRSSFSKVLLKDGLVYLDAGLETFINKDQLEQGVFTLEPFLVTPIQHYGNFMARTFFKARIILGKERFRGETLHLSTDPYFSGDEDLYGTSLISLSTEKDFIAPWDVLGFKIALYVFADGSLISDTPYRPKRENIITTEGFGCRLRNPRLIWKSIELQVAWNQSRGKFGSPIFSLSTKLPLKLLDFEGRRPKPYLYR